MAIDAANGEVVGVNGVGDFERAENLVLNREAGEVVGEIAAVDLDGTGAGLQADACDGGLAAALTATRPRGLPAASMTQQLRFTSSDSAENFFMRD